MPTPLNIAGGVMASAKAALVNFTSPQQMQLNVCNAGTNGTQTVTLSMTPSGGSSYTLGQWVLAAGESFNWPSLFPQNVGSGDAIEGFSTNGSSSHWVLGRIA